MKKIPTIFVRDMTCQPALVTPEWNPQCLWVRDGEGIATIKIDGTCCMVRDGKLYKRREIKAGQPRPADFEEVETDPITGKAFGWVAVGAGPDDRWHREAVEVGMPADGTYELVGPKVQGNKYGLPKHQLWRHGALLAPHDTPRDFDGLYDWLAALKIEGLVWHHPDGRRAKIKRRDFGLKW